MAQSSTSSPATIAAMRAAVDSLLADRRCVRARPGRVGLLAPGVGIPPWAAVPPAGGVAVEGVAVDGVAVDGVAVDGVAADGVVVDGVAGFDGVAVAGVVFALVVEVVPLDVPWTRAEAGTGNEGAPLT